MRRESLARWSLLAAREAAAYSTNGPSGHSTLFSKSVVQKSGSAAQPPRAYATHVDDSRRHASAAAQSQEVPPGVPHVPPITAAEDISPNPDAQFYKSVDGSHATAHVAYALADTVCMLCLCLWLLA